MIAPSRRRSLYLTVIAAAFALIVAAAWLVRGKLDAPPTMAARAALQTTGQRPPAARKIGENHWAVADWARAEYLQDLRRATRETRLTPEPAADPKLIRRLVITQLEPESPAYLGGFRISDEIAAVNGAPVGTLQRAVNLIAEIRSAKTLAVRVRRAGRDMDFRFDFE